MLKIESEYESENSSLGDKEYKLECLKRRRKIFESESIKKKLSSKNSQYYIQKAAVLLYQDGEFVFEETGKCEERNQYIEGMLIYCGYNGKEIKQIKERMIKERMKEEKLKENRHPFKISRLINMILNK